MATLRIEIETDSEEQIYQLLNHVFREITEGSDYFNSDLEYYAKTNENWLVVEGGRCKGKYCWKKDGV